MVGFDLDPQLSLALRTGSHHDHPSQLSSESTSSSEVIQATDDHTREERCNGKASEKRSTITLFYDGMMCTSTVTEIQARAIISMAKREMEKGIRSQENNPITTVYPQNLLADIKKNSGSFPADQPQFLPNSSDQMILNQGLSMKHSLQRFLQKRKARVANSASPYSRPNCCS